MAALALVAALPVLSVCVDGVSPPVPGDRVEQLALAPVFASTVASAEPRPINAIRLTVFEVPGDAVLARTTTAVDPDQAEWTVEVEVPVEAGVASPDIYVLMELLNVAGGTETVEWSGRSRVLALDLSGQLEVQAVEVFRGPPANLDVTGLTIAPHDSLFEEGAETGVSAQVQPASVAGAVAFWETDDPAVATVSGAGGLQGRVVFQGPGRVTLTAEAGGARASTTFRVVQAPDSVGFLPASRVTLESIEDTVRLRSLLLDPRGDSIPGEAFTWSVPQGSPVRHLGDGVFQALRPGEAVVTAVPDRAPELAGTATLAVVQVARSVEAEPSEVYLGALGQRATLSGTARDGNGFPLETTTFTFRSTRPGVAVVDAAGVVTARGNGVARVLVQMDGAVDTVGVTVGGALASIRVTPESHRFTRAGDTLRYRAEALGPDGSVLPTLTRFDWSVSDAAVATVGGDGLVTAVDDGVATVTAEVGEVRGVAEAEVVRTVAAVEVTPAADTLESVGATVQLQAQALDAAGDEVERRETTWRSLTPAVATVDASGVVTAVADGQARIEAQVGEAVGAAVVTVRQAVARVDVTPPSFAFVALGATRQFTAQALDPGGATVARVGSFRWTSSDTTVVSVDAAGLATARGEGEAELRAEVDGVTGVAEVRVELEAVVAEVLVSPTDRTFTGRGQAQAFTAAALDASGDTLPDVTDFTWSSTDPAVVTVAADGTATAVAPGMAQVRAEAGGIFGLASVTVAVPLDRVEVTPATHTFDRAGETLALDAVAFDADDFAVPEVTDFTWSTSDISVVQVGPSGVAEAVDDGTATVTASHMGIQGTATLTVARIPTGVAIEPAAPAPLTFFGETRALDARVEDAAGLPMLVSPTWISLDPGIATVSAGGVVTAVAEGTARIVAARDGVADTVTVTVAQAVSYVSVSPRDHTFNAPGQTRTFTAQAFDAGAAPVAGVTSFSWASSDPSVAAVSPSVGSSTVVTSAADGSVDVTATANGVTGTAPVRVSSTVASVTIAPAPPPTLTSLGATLDLGATTRDVLGNELARPLSWSSLADTVATVDASGLVTAVTNGTARIVATSEGEADTVTVTVEQAVGFVTVTPGSHTFSVIGATRAFTAEAFDAGGAPVTPAPTFTWASTDDGVTTVDASGVATAVADGSAVVTAAAGGKEGSASVTVGIAVTSIEVTPGIRSFASRGETQAFTAVARDAGGSVIPSVAGFTWSTSDGDVVSVAPSSGAGTTGTAVADGTATLTAGAGGVTGTATLEVARVAASLTVTPPAPATLTSLGATLSLSATVADALGEPMAEPVTWSSLDPGVATVSASGVMTAVADGTASIVASSGALADTVAVTVAQAVSRVTVTPGSRLFDAVGDTLTFTAQAFDAGAAPVSPAPVFTWASSDPGVATVDASGLATAVANGTTTVTATAGGVQGAASVTVGIAVASVEVTPAAPTLTSRGETRTFTAVARDGGGAPIGSVTSFTWSSADLGVVTVDPGSGSSTTGTAVADGTTTVTAEAAGVSGTATVAVARVAQALTVSPAGPPTLTALGATLTLTASVTDALGEPMAEPVTWSSPDAAATVDASGVVTAVANGTARIVATSGALADTVTVTVAQEVAAVAVIPTSHAFTLLGETRTFTAEARDAGGAAVSPAPTFTWSSSAVGVATVDASGLATAVADGSATITAEAGGHEGAASVTVEVPGASLDITPASPPTLASIGATTQLTGTVRDGGGNLLPDATVTWSALDPTVATVSATGLVTAARDGSARIEARYEGGAGVVRDTVTVTVAQAVDTVVLSPASVAMAPGDPELALSAEARDAGGTPVPGAVFTWASLDPGVATVTAVGLLTAVADGSTTVEATASGVTGAAAVVVTSGAVTRTFTADASGDLLDPANWEPAGVPGADDDLVLSAGTTATLSSDFSLGSLTLEAGATLEVTEGSTLELTGDLDATGGITGSGTVEMSGTGTVTGTVPNLDVTGSATVSGSLTVSGDLETADGGVLTMDDPADQLSVEGDLLMGGGDTDGELTSGTIYLAGQLINVTTSFKTFNPSGDHTVVFNGTSPQHVTLSFPGENQHRFQNIVVDNPTQVIFDTSIPILGDAVVDQGVLTAADTIRTDVGGSITDNAGGGWQMPTTAVTGAAPLLPSTLATDLEIPAATTLQNSVTVTGDVTVTGSSASLDLGGHDLTVTGDFSVENSGLLTMTDAASDLTVQGETRFGGRSTVGSLTAGRILASGDFRWVGVKVDPFAPSGSHEVVFTGGTSQTVFFAAGGNRVYAFQNLRVAAGADVTPEGDLTVKGDMVLEGTFTVPVSTTLTILGTLTDPEGGLVILGTLVGG